MLSNKEFDLWADDYDESVHLHEEANKYPFAGYKQVLGTIYKIIKAADGKKILDIGFGTAVLSKKLYDDGLAIYGIDFSERMVEIAKQKMPEAILIQHNFTKGLPTWLTNESFDFIICTYAIHHLDDQQKCKFIKELLEHLPQNGKLLIGDVAFNTIYDMEQCKKQAGDAWDNDEIYPVVEVLGKTFPGVQFKKISFCSGVMSLIK